jgi:hypothetical protein
MADKDKVAITFESHETDVGHPAFALSMTTFFVIRGGKIVRETTYYESGAPKCVK